MVRRHQKLRMGENAAHSQNKILHGNLNLDPLVIRQRWPDEMRFRNGGLVGVKNDLRLFIVNMQSTQEEDETRESSVARDRLQPVIYSKCEIGINQRGPDLPYRLKSTICGCVAR